MSTNLAVTAEDQDTLVVHVEFTDHEGAPVVPDSLAWSLFGADGEVINSRADEPITPASSIDIALTGADLDVADGDVRFLQIAGAYTSDLGSLAINKWAQFQIEGPPVVVN